jgi:hypothetical protein
MALLRKIVIGTLFVSTLWFIPTDVAHAITLGCSKAQADSKSAGYAASVSIQAETRYVERSKFTEAYQEYLAANKFTLEWKKIVSKSPKCFKDERTKIDPIFRNFYVKATMCERYGNSICKKYPSKRAPIKQLTLEDICGKNSYSASYIECIENLGGPDRYGYAD